METDDGYVLWTDSYTGQALPELTLVVLKDLPG
jgi:hypothetical protein